MAQRTEFLPFSRLPQELMDKILHHACVGVPHVVAVRIQDVEVVSSEQAGGETLQILVSLKSASPLFAVCSASREVAKMHQPVYEQRGGLAATARRLPPVYFNPEIDTLFLTNFSLQKFLIGKTSQEVIKQTFWWDGPQVRTIAIPFMDFLDVLPVSNTWSGYLFSAEERLTKTALNMFRACLHVKGITNILFTIGEIDVTAAAIAPILVRPRTTPLEYFVDGYRWAVKRCMYIEWGGSRDTWHDLARSFHHQFRVVSDFGVFDTDRYDIEWDDEIEAEVFDLKRIARPNPGNLNHRVFDKIQSDPCEGYDWHTHLVFKKDFHPMRFEPNSPYNPVFLFCEMITDEELKGSTQPLTVLPCQGDSTWVENLIEETWAQAVIDEHGVQPNFWKHGTRYTCRNERNSDASALLLLMPVY